MKKIPLSGKLGEGRYAIVDDEDYDFIAVHRWSYKSGYAYTNIPELGGTYRAMFMHRIINRTPVGFDTDHINGVGLDNRRSNLRTCSHADNVRNRHSANRNSKTGVRGVSWDRRMKKWRAQVGYGKCAYLGCFESIEAASAAVATVGTIQKY